MKKIYKVNKYIDHTNLKQFASEKDISNLCDEAIKYSFFSVCVNPDYVSFCKNKLKNTNVKICTVIGFPLGSNTTETKIYETKDAIKNGADEMDMVLNISWLKRKKLTKVIDEINEIKKICKNKILKVIIETCLLTKNDIINACKCINKSKADFIKTSTGFSTGGAKIEDIKLIKKYLDKSKLIKASGGIKIKEQALKFIKLGVKRIGTSNGVEIIK